MICKPLRGATLPDFGATPWLSLSEAGHSRGHFLVRVGKAAHS